MPFLGFKNRIRWVATSGWSPVCAIVGLPPQWPVKNPKHISVGVPSDVFWGVHISFSMLLETSRPLSNAAAHLAKSSMLDLNPPAPAFQAWAYSGARPIGVETRWPAKTPTLVRV